MASSNRKYVNCSVWGCVNTSKTCDLTFFSLPVDTERREKWLRLITREDLIGNHSASTHHRVCEEHFVKTDIMPNQVRKILKKKAMPTRKLQGCPKQDAATQTIRAALIDNSVQTINWRIVQHKGVQTLKKYANEPKRKRQIETQAEADPLSIICQEEEEEAEESEEAQRATFHKLCDKFLTKKLAKLVKAQTE